MFYIHENDTPLHKDILFQNPQFVEMYHETLRALHERKGFILSIKSSTRNPQFLPYNSTDKINLYDHEGVKTMTNLGPLDNAQKSSEYFGSHLQYFQVSGCYIDTTSLLINFRGKFISLGQNEFIIDKNSKECKLVQNMLQNMYDILQSSTDYSQLCSQEKSNYSTAIDTSVTSIKTDMTRESLGNIGNIDNAHLGKVPTNSKKRKYLKKVQYSTSQLKTQKTWQRQSFHDSNFMLTNGRTQSTLNLSNEKIGDSTNVSYSKRNVDSKNGLTARNSNIPVRVKKI